MLAILIIVFFLIPKEPDLGTDIIGMWIACFGMPRVGTCSDYLHFKGEIPHCGQGANSVFLYILFTEIKRNLLNKLLSKWVLFLQITDTRPIYVMEDEEYIHT